MIKSLSIVIICLLIATLEAPKLKKEKLKKEKLKKEGIVFGLLLTIAATLAILATLNILLPNPNDWLFTIFLPVNTWITNVLT